MTAPSVLAPLLAAAQEVNVAAPGSEPDLTQTPVPEDLSLLGGDMVDSSGALLLRQSACPANARMQIWTEAAAVTRCRTR